MSKRGHTSHIRPARLRITSCHLIHSPIITNPFKNHDSISPSLPQVHKSMTMWLRIRGCYPSSEGVGRASCSSFRILQHYTRLPLIFTKMRHSSVLWLSSLHTPTVFADDECEAGSTEMRLASSALLTRCLIGTCTCVIVFELAGFATFIFLFNKVDILL